MFMDYLPVVLASPLFKDISQQQAVRLLRCLAPRVISGGKGENVIDAFQQDGEFGILLEGKIYGEKVDFSGERFIAGEVLPSGVFGEILAGLPRQTTITIRVEEPMKALVFTLSRVISGCGVRCEGHGRLMKNLFALIGVQYFSLQERIYYLTRKTLRGKIIAYLSDQAKKAGSMTFRISYTRETLAEYLGADRSALSRELSAMKKEGLLDVYRGSFKLLAPKAFLEESEN
ncbi:MAG TPA: Crp/Fnr family transcriptional regulator [Clostridiales bacterium]|jgi:CRP-like cAMP-binding protein|nr:Crp/Fnr family transcriptional regulator [Clostridiales bacterium]